MSTGSWNVNIIDKMPQTVATAMANLNETLLGADYEFLAYLGSQLVNGTNHAVLAKQTVLSGRDTENIVVIIFNEKPGDTKASLVNIERVIEGGAPMGGTRLCLSTQLTEEFQAAWDTAFEGFLGSKVEPVMQLATQVVKGVNYVYLATMSPVSSNPQNKVVIITINPMERAVSFADALASRQGASLGYAFSW